MKIFTLDGRLAQVTNIQNGAVQTSVDVSRLSKGIYIVVFANGNDKQSFKFEKY